MTRFALSGRLQVWMAPEPGKRLGPLSIRISLESVPPGSALHPVTTYDSSPVGMMTGWGSKSVGVRRTLEQAVQGKGCSPADTLSRHRVAVAMGSPPGCFVPTASHRDLSFSGHL